MMLAITAASTTPCLGTNVRPDFENITFTKINKFMRRGVDQNMKHSPRSPSIRTCVCVCGSWYSRSIAWLVDGRS